MPKSSAFKVKLVIEWSNKPTEHHKIKDWKTTLDDTWCSFIAFLSAEDLNPISLKMPWWKYCLKIWVRLTRDPERSSVHAVLRCYTAGVWSAYWGLLSWPGECFSMTKWMGVTSPQRSTLWRPPACAGQTELRLNTHVLLSHSRHQTHLHPSKFSLQYRGPKVNSLSIDTELNVCCELSSEGRFWLKQRSEVALSAIYTCGMLYVLWIMQNAH